MKGAAVRQKIYFVEHHSPSQINHHHHHHQIDQIHSLMFDSLIPFWMSRAAARLSFHPPRALNQKLASRLAEVCDAHALWAPQRERSGSAVEVF